jgi:Family of unknown function (DUF6065)
MKLLCHALRPDPLTIRPALATRRWMDAIPDNHAYRCLPLNIANAHGWEILSPCAFFATWTGGLLANAITLAPLDDYPELHRFVVSHFAHGIVTFHLSYLFRTEPGWNLFASGSLNAPKDGIAPLTGVIETDWLPYPFTMNWQMTRPGTVRFDKDEPICAVFPVPQGTLQEVEPEILNLEDDPELQAQTMAWKERRDEFMKKFNAKDPMTMKEAWQRFYFVGKLADGRAPAAEHLHKLRLNSPVDRRVPKKGRP